MNPPGRLSEARSETAGRALHHNDLASGRRSLRFNALDVPGVIAKLTTILGNKDISIAAVMQHESNPGEFTPIVITTHDAKQGNIDTAIAEIESLNEIEGTVVSIRIAEFASDS